MVARRGMVVATLFQPLRRRTQAGIDLRFYLSKYDATRTLAAFGATLRKQGRMESTSPALE